MKSKRLQRRRIIGAGLGSGIVVWSTPVILSVVLPAHAVTSVEDTESTEDEDVDIELILDLIGIFLDQPSITNTIQPTSGLAGQHLLSRLLPDANATELSSTENRTEVVLESISAGLYSIRVAKQGTITEASDSECPRVVRELCVFESVAVDGDPVVGVVTTCDGKPPVLIDADIACVINQLTSADAVISLGEQKLTLTAGDGSGIARSQCLPQCDIGDASDVVSTQ